MGIEYEGSGLTEHPLFKCGAVLLACFPWVLMERGGAIDESFEDQVRRQNSSKERWWDNTYYALKDRFQIALPHSSGRIKNLRMVHGQAKDIQTGR